MPGLATAASLPRKRPSGSSRDIEMLPDGILRETVRGGSPTDEAVTRTLKTERTTY